MNRASTIGKIIKMARKALLHRDPCVVVMNATDYKTMGERFAPDALKQGLPLHYKGVYFCIVVPWGEPEAMLVSDFERIVKPLEAKS